MSALAYVLALLAFVFVMFGVPVLGQSGTDLVAGGLAFLALGLLLGSVTRGPIR